MGRKSRAKLERPTPPETQPQTASQYAGAPVTAPPPDARQLAVVSAILVALIIVVYAQLRSHQFIGYDDNIYVTQNDHVRAGLTAAGVQWAFTSMEFNWHPITWLTHMTDVQLFGVNAPAHLFVNVFYHAINSVLVLLVLAFATHRLWPSAFVAAAFAVHPAHVESVAWIAERKDVLSTFFFLAALLFYLRFVRTRSIASYAGLASAFILGLMSKGMVVTLPFVLLMLDYWPLQRIPRFDRRSIVPLIREKLLLFAIVVPGVVINFVAQKAAHAFIDAKKAPLLARSANAAISYVAYIGKLVWPSSLALPYPYRVVIAPSKAILSTLLLIVITVAVIALRTRRPYLLVGWLWFVGTLLPVIGLVQVGAQAMADRYTYIPSIGFFMAIAFWAADLVAHRPALRVPAWAASCAAIAALTVVAFVQTSYWRDAGTLFRHSIAVTQRNIYAHLSLGEALLRQNKPEEAAREFETANAIFPGLALTHHNLGEAYAAMNQLDYAENEYRTALEIDPNDQQVLSELAGVAQRLGRDGEAKQAMIRAGAIAGDPAAVAAAALQRGQTQDALAGYTAIVKAKPRSAAPHNDLAAALARAGRDDEALAQYTEALKLDPKLYDAQMNIAALLSRHDRNDEALAHLNVAAELHPKSPEPHVYLALLLAQMGRKPDAAREGRTALAIDEPAANAQFTDAVRIPPGPDNLRQWVATLGPPSS